MKILYFTLFVPGVVYGRAIDVWFEVPGGEDVFDIIRWALATVCFIAGVWAFFCASSELSENRYIQSMITMIFGTLFLIMVKAIM